MSLHDDVSGVFGSINPNQPIIVQNSTGFTTAPGGTRTPTYGAPVNTEGQVQDLSGEELKHLNDLHLSGILAKIWTSQPLSSVDRASGRGGDLVTLADGTVWLVVRMLESWADWCAAVIQKQVDQ